jgi:carbon-monoxide dehydrogenase large subunit
MGAQVKRKEDPRLITGMATYTGDIRLPGMRYVALVRSPFAHARILGVDTEAARAMPGVDAVFTGANLAPEYEPMPMASSGEGESTQDERDWEHTRHALSVERVRYVGEPVAAVVADTRDRAEAAAREVAVEWEELPAVVDPEAAREPGAPQLFANAPNNVEHVWTRKAGDPDAAFAAAHRVVRQRMNNQRLCGVPMEGRAVVAAPDGMTGGLTIWTSTQAPHLSRHDIAEALRMPENLLHVVVPEVGGGFGVKIGIYPEDVALGAMARKLGVPLSWVESRTEHMAATTHGRAQHADAEVAVEEDGRVTALRMRILADLGAYPLAPDIVELTGRMATGVYDIPNIDLEATTVFTNTTPVAAYRGAGRPEAAYYIERMMDVVADELGMDPVEVRRRNFLPPDAFPHETPTGELYDSGEYDKALSRALEISRYEELRAEQKRRRDEDAEQLLGIGVACWVEMCGFGPYESAVVRVESTGTVTVFTGVSPHGQGQETTFAQIVADQLGVEFDRIVVRHGDTRETPMGVGTMGSRGLAVGGAALMGATAKVQDKARKIAAHMLEAAPEDVVLQDGRYGVQGAPDRGLTLAEIADKAYSDELPDDLDPGLEATSFFKPPDLVYPFGAHVAVVEVERDTGLVTLRDYYSVDDCGPRISPMLVEGQVHGGLAQGIAQALFEEVVYDEQGQLLSGSLMDYAVPRASAFPAFTTDATVTPTPHNPLGAKGIGEAATIGSTPTVANAVADALEPFGVGHLDMPLKPERVWRAMQG